MAIQSGITNFLGDGCNYKLPATYTEINPAARYIIFTIVRINSFLINQSHYRYDQIPIGCKIGNGIGLCTYFALIAGSAAVYIKYIVSHDESVAAAAGEYEIMKKEKQRSNDVSGYAYEEEVPALHQIDDDSKEESRRE